MFIVICGTALAVAASVSFWYFLPRHGRVHPLIEKFDGGSMITLVIMTLFATGLVMVFAGFLG